MPSFIKIYPLSTDISHQTKSVLTYGHRPNRQTTSPHNVSRRVLLAGKAHKRNATQHKAIRKQFRTWYSILTQSGTRVQRSLKTAQHHRL